MNLLVIKYYLAIVEEGSISAAARKLFISQQTLSEHVKKLETEMGTPLFKRGKTLTLTLAGECFFDEGKRLVNLYDEMLSNVDHIVKNRRSRITVAVPTYATPLGLTDIIMTYRAKYSQYDVAIAKRQHNDIVHNMNGVDLYMSYLPLSDGLENITLIDHDPYCITFHKSLAERIYGDQWDSIEEKLIKTQDLSLVQQMPFLLQRDRYFQLVEDARLIFQEYQFTPVVAYNSESSRMNEQFCQNGAGCLLATESHISQRFYGENALQIPNLLSYPIRVNSFETRLAISHQKGKRLHTAELTFINEAQAYFKQKSFAAIW